MRILGLDYGDKNIGVSVSDELLKIAFGVECIRRDNPNSFKKSISRIKELIKQYSVNKIVLGFPKNMDNSLGERCSITIDFRDRLLRNLKRIEIILWDERLSTSFSVRSLKEADLSREKIDNVVDKMAAVYILQGYLDSLKI